MQATRLLVEAKLGTCNWLLIWPPQIKWCALANLLQTLHEHNVLATQVARVEEEQVQLASLLVLYDAKVHTNLSCEYSSFDLPS